jgi:hypothetical protein
VSTISTIAGIPPNAGNSGSGSCTSLPSCVPSPFVPCYPYAASGPATATSLEDPSDAEPTADGGVLIADTYNNAVRYVSPDGTTMTTIAGAPAALAPTLGMCDDVISVCDGQAAGAVELDRPDSVSATADGSGAVLVAEYDGDAVREVSSESPSGTFTTVAGLPGVAGYVGDGGPATAALLNHPQHVTSLTGGAFLIADTGNEVIRQVSSAGVISTIAGSGVASFGGDGGAATGASFESPTGVAPLANGNILVADQDNNRIREVTTPPAATISLSPSSPNGSGGWFVTVPTVTVTANQNAAVQCELDPAAAPTAFAAIAPGCPYTGAGATITTDGPHMVYAAGQNGFGDTSKPIGVPVNVDVGPPTITCKGNPTFRFGNATAEVTATLSDSVSGPASEPLSSSAVTAYVGAASAPVSGSNNAGTQGTGYCPYFVEPLSLHPTPKATLAYSSATQYVTLTELLIKDIPAGATVVVTCKGAGCPFKRHTHVRTRRCGTCKRTRPPARMVNLAGLFGGAHLQAGVTIAASIVEDGTVGRYLTFVVRDGKLAANRPRCLAAGATKPHKKQPCIPKKPKG